MAEPASYDKPTETAISDRSVAEVDPNGQAVLEMVEQVMQAFRGLEQLQQKYVNRALPGLESEHYSTKLYSSQVIELVEKQESFNRVLYAALAQMRDNIISQRLKGTRATFRF